jgi:hypothetical protein
MGQPLSVGRVVHYRLPVAEGYPATWRPALVVNEFDGKLGNLKVELDPANDLRQDVGLRDGLAKLGHYEVVVDHFHAYSANEGDQPGNWRWPPQVKAPAEPKKPAAPALGDQKAALQ